MNEDGPNGSPYGTPVKHDQSETKRDMCGTGDEVGVASVGEGVGNMGIGK
jgi:hypothetical protein